MVPRASTRPSRSARSSPGRSPTPATSTCNGRPPWSAWSPSAVSPSAGRTGTTRAPPPNSPTTLVEFRLEPTPRGTRLTVVESGFEALPPGRGKALRENSQGWTEQMENIRAHVRG